ncbi:PIG-L family deacetylase [Micromonospora purpureochromogenes]|uniref:PIG-L deacetylase family protein n=1 Tax=Micromonospora purpureochromogenes TaxID=47872 RepID=UPI0033E39A78
MSFPAPAPALPDVHRALAVFAHPDDVDFGCAGTIAGWVEDGVAVGYLIVTRGDGGGFDATARERTPRLREAEQRAAAPARPGRPGTDSGPGTTGCRGRRGWFVRR